MGFVFPVTISRKVVQPTIKKNISTQSSPLSSHSLASTQIENIRPLTHQNRLFLKSLLNKFRK